MLTHPLGEFRHVDDGPLVRTDADFLFALARPHRELEPAPLALGHLSLTGDMSRNGGGATKRGQLFEPYLD